MKCFPVRNEIHLYMVLKNRGIAHVIIVQNNTLPFEVLLLKMVHDYLKKKGYAV